MPHVSGVTELTPDCSHLVLASDGLWDTITPQSAMDVILAVSVLLSCCCLVVLLSIVTHSFVLSCVVF